MASTHQLIDFTIVAAKLTDWLQRFLWIAQVVFIVVVLVVVYSAADQNPPFALLSHKPITVKAGKMAAIDVPVWRDASRHCDATLDRYLFDSSGRRFDILSSAKFPDAVIRAMNERTPGRMLIGIQIPPLRSGNDDGIEPGQARLVSHLEYVCNKGHYFLWPIQLQTEIALVIEP